MSEPVDVTFTGGHNIAMRVPPHLWDATVEFYRDVLGLPVIEHPPPMPPSVCFAFGARIEPLPEDYEGIWIANPASIIHHVAGAEQPRSSQPGQDKGGSSHC